MMMKGQVKRSDGRDSAGQVKFVVSLFEVAASIETSRSSRVPQHNSCNTTSTRTTQLYNRTNDELTLDEIERIMI